MGHGSGKYQRGQKWNGECGEPPLHPFDSFRLDVPNTTPSCSAWPLLRLYSGNSMVTTNLAVDQIIRCLITGRGCAVTLRFTVQKLTVRSIIGPSKSVSNTKAPSL